MVGVGSVGTRCWVILLRGCAADDALLLQVKQAQDSVLNPVTGLNTYDNQGQRVVAGQRLIQAVSDIFLGWQRAEPLRVAFTTTTCGSYATGRAQWSLTRCGWQGSRNSPNCAAGRWHEHTPDPGTAPIAGYLGTSSAFDEALVTFAERYAEQNQQDYEVLRAAITSGRRREHRRLAAPCIPSSTRCGCGAGCRRQS